MPRLTSDYGAPIDFSRPGRPFVVAGRERFIPAALITASARIRTITAQSPKISIQLWTPPLAGPSASPWLSMIGSRQQVRFGRGQSRLLWCEPG